MTVVDLDGSAWASRPDFYTALLGALGAPHWHGAGIDALIDSMVWGGINEIEPPYVVRVSGLGAVPESVRREVEEARDALVQARREHRDINGADVEVSLELT